MDELLTSVTPEQEIYREHILDHYRHPRNKKRVLQATHTSHGHNPLCGDALDVYLTVDGNVIADIGFDGSGCAISQAAMSLLTERIKGMTVDEVLSLEREFMLKELGIVIGAVRMKCALLGLRTTQDALRLCRPSSAEPTTQSSSSITGERHD